MQVYVMGYIEIDADEDDDVHKAVRLFFQRKRVDFDLDDVEVCEEDK